MTSMAAPHSWQWGLLHQGERTAPMLLVLSPSDQRYRELLARHHVICDQVAAACATRGQQ